MPEYRSRAAVERVAERLARQPCVAATDVVAADPLAVVVEVTLEPGLARVPPSVHRVLWEEDAGVADVSPQGSPAHLVATVR